MVKELIVTDSFKKDYQKLPKPVQKKLDKQLKHLVSNPKHPSLNIHRLKGPDDYWEFYIDRFYRGVFRQLDERIILLFAGTHQLIDRW